LINLNKLILELEEFHEVISLPVKDNEVMINIDDQFEITLYHDEKLNFDSFHISGEGEEMFFELNKAHGNLFILENLCDFMLEKMI
tara:strand:+ start:7687 stop:7944 length:258 start_codon:yes stop_codon:yes gene_type:complete